MQVPLRLDGLLLIIYFLEWPSEPQAWALCNLAATNISFDWNGDGATIRWGAVSSLDLRCRRPFSIHERSQIKAINAINTIKGQINKCIYDFLHAPKMNDLRLQLREEKNKSNTQIHIYTTVYLVDISFTSKIRSSGVGRPDFWTNGRHWLAPNKQFRYILATYTLRDSPASRCARHCRDRRKVSRSASIRATEPSTPASILRNS